jgi:3-phosphoshikimate 1-carboxyvinyltransferase
MNDRIEILPIFHALHASVRLPGSKSLTNRVLLLAVLADGVTVLRNALFSDDSAYFAGALRQLGFSVSLDPAQSEMTVEGQGGAIPAGNAELFIGNAGTAARFLTAFLTLGNGCYSLDGDARMRERPIGDLVAALESLGAIITEIQLGSSKTFARPFKFKPAAWRVGGRKLRGTSPASSFPVCSWWRRMRTTRSKSI